MILAVALSLLAFQDPQVVDGVIVRPEWVETPTAEQLTPEGVRKPTRPDYRPSGAIHLRCIVKVDGLLDDCRIVMIATPYPELGLTAFAAARHFRHAPRLEDGRLATGMPVLIKLRWEPPSA